MRYATLKRVGHLPDGTYGRLIWPGLDVPILTAERPWLNNAVGESCIPPGIYKCQPRYYNTGGYDAVEICDVPGRTQILFHCGNFTTTDETRGCVLVGLEPWVDGGRRGVKHSRRAWDLLEAAGFLAEEFLLEVTT